MAPHPVRLSFNEIYTAVRDDIVSGRHRPGQRIAIADLAARIRVSTTPVREALARLVGRGLLEQRRSEGYYLTRLDARDIRDLYAFHEYCVVRAYPMVAANLADVSEAEFDAWAVFDYMTAAAGDAIVHAVRGYIDDRLKPLRHIERQILGEAVDADIVALTRPSCPLHRAIALIEQFHRIRKDIANELAIGFGRS